MPFKLIKDIKEHKNATLKQQTRIADALERANELKEDELIQKATHFLYERCNGKNSSNIATDKKVLKKLLEAHGSMLKEILKQKTKKR